MASTRSARLMYFGLADDVAETFCLGRVEDGRGSLGPMTSAPPLGLTDPLRDLPQWGPRFEAMLLRC
jgi:hypothetical protein